MFVPIECSSACSRFSSPYSGVIGGVGKIHTPTVIHAPMIGSDYRNGGPGLRTNVVPRFCFHDQDGAIQALALLPIADYEGDRISGWFEICGIDDEALTIRGLAARTAPLMDDN